MEGNVWVLTGSLGGLVDEGRVPDVHEIITDRFWIPSDSLPTDQFPSSSERSQNFRPSREEGRLLTSSVTGPSRGVVMLITS